MNFAWKCPTSTNIQGPLHVVNLRHGTNGFTSLPKEGVLRNFSPLKNPTASAGFEPANLGTKGQHATCRPPKPLYLRLRTTNLSSKCRFSDFHSPHALFLPTFTAYSSHLLSLFVPTSFYSIFPPAHHIGKRKGPGTTLIVLHKQFFSRDFIQLQRKCYATFSNSYDPLTFQCLQILQQKRFSPQVIAVFEEPFFQFDHTLSGLNPPQLSIQVKFFPRRTNRLTANLQDTVFAFQLHAS